MRLGIISRHIERDDIESLAAAIAGYGLRAVQLNLESAVVAPLDEPFPASFDAALAERVRTAFADRDIAISAISGTFNAIDPDQDRLREHIARFPTLLRWCRALGCDVVTACTGTRDPVSMWRAHPANHQPDAWRDLLTTMRLLMPTAEEQGVTIAFEPEVVNVVDTAEKAQRLIAEVGSRRLQVVMDPANYFHPSTLPMMREVLDDAFARVGRDIALAHAKDVRGPNPGGTECVRPAAGTGVLDYARYIELLRNHAYDGALIMHSLAEAEVPTSAAYVRRFLDGPRS